MKSRRVSLHRNLDDDSSSKDVDDDDYSSYEDDSSSEEKERDVSTKSQDGKKDKKINKKAVSSNDDDSSSEDEEDYDDSSSQDDDVVKLPGKKRAKTITHGEEEDEDSSSEEEENDSSSSEDVEKDSSSEEEEERDIPTEFENMKLAWPNREITIGDIAKVFEMKKLLENRKRKAAPPPDVEDDDDSSSEEEGRDKLPGQEVSRDKTNTLRKGWEYLPKRKAVPAPDEDNRNVSLLSFDDDSSSKDVDDDDYSSYEDDSSSEEKERDVPTKSQDGKKDKKINKKAVSSNDDDSSSEYEEDDDDSSFQDDDVVKLPGKKRAKRITHGEEEDDDSSSEEEENDSSSSEDVEKDSSSEEEEERDIPTEFENMKLAWQNREITIGDIAKVFEMKKLLENRKRKAAPPPDVEDDDDSSSEEEGRDKLPGQEVSRDKTNTLRKGWEYLPKRKAVPAPDEDNRNVSLLSFDDDSSSKDVDDDDYSSYEDDSSSEEKERDVPTKSQDGKKDKKINKKAVSSNDDDSSSEYEEDDDDSSFQDDDVVKLPGKKRAKRITHGEEEDDDSSSEEEENDSSSSEDVEKDSSSEEEEERDIPTEFENMKLAWQNREITIGDIAKVFEMKKLLENRKRKAAPPPDVEDDDDSSSEEEGRDKLPGQEVSRDKTNTLRKGWEYLPKRKAVPAPDEDNRNVSLLSFDDDSSSKDVDDDDYSSYEDDSSSEEKERDVPTKSQDGKKDKKINKKAVSSNDSSSEYEEDDDDSSFQDDDVVKLPGKKRTISIRGGVWERKKVLQFLDRIEAARAPVEKDHDDSVSEDVEDDDDSSSEEEERDKLPGLERDKTNTLRKGWEYVPKRKAVPAPDEYNRNVSLLSFGNVPFFMNNTGRRINRNQWKYADGRRPNVTKWDDLEPGKKECYNLYHLDSNRRIIKLGHKVFSSLRGVVTKRAICQLMLLAYNLKGPNGDWVFGPVNPELIGKNPDFSEIKETPLTNSRETMDKLTNTVPITHDDYEKRTSIGYCYLAASYLRLYTKSAFNYYHIGDHLSSRFEAFYDFPLPFRNYHPNNSVIDCVKAHIEMNPVLKHTFYCLLYAGESREEGKELKKFLYGLHTEYTGLHCYALFLKCMERYKIGNTDLIDALWKPDFATELSGLREIFNSHFGTEALPGKERQMWRYARIFDDRFFSNLQTKNCVVFTATLAYLYHASVPAKGNQSALNIAQIKGMSPGQKKYAQFAARRVRAIIMSKVPRNIPKDQPPGLQKRRRFDSSK